MTFDELLENFGDMFTVAEDPQYSKLIATNMQKTRYAIFVFLHRLRKII